MKTALCAACNRQVPTSGRGLFGQHTCPNKGADATDPALGHNPCPVHGTLVWVVGPYSAFRGCGDPRCTAGEGGKQYRSRGLNVRTPGGRIASPGVLVPAPNPAPPPADIGSINLANLGALGQAIQVYVDNYTRSLVSEAIADIEVPDRGPARVEWTVNDRPFAAIEGTSHKALPRMLKLYAAGFRNFLIVGPAGSGKTTLARDLARALTLPDQPAVNFASVSCTAGMSESALTGRLIPNLTDGSTVFQTTDFVRTYEGGGVYLIDEVDAADPNVMLVINSALANGHMPLPNRVDTPHATRNPEAVIVCAANTWGRGADRQYVGRNQLDAAFLDRFVGATVEVDYDRDLESKLVGDAHICATVWTIRDKVADLKLRRVVGTRFLLAVTRLVRGAGESITEAIEACTIDWTPDERAKAGVRS